MSKLHVVISDRSGNILPTFRPERVSGLRFSTEVNCGYRDCSFRYGCSLTEAFLFYLGRMNYRVQVCEGATVRWEGRLDTAEITLSGCNITARGYARAAYDQPYSGSFSAAEHADDIITTILAASCPDLTAGTIGDPGTVIANITYGDNQYPGDIFTKLAEAGSATARWYWYVWEGKTLDFEAKNTTVNWVCELADLAPDGLRLSRSLEEIWNQVRADYAAAGARSTTADADNTDSQAKYGLTRTRAINAGEVTQTTAEALRDVSLAESADRPQQSSLRLKRVRGGQAGNIGLILPLWRIRAGQVLQVTNLVPSAAQVDSATLDALRTFHVFSTDYDVDNNTMTISPDRPEQTTERILAALAMGTGDNVQRLAAYFTRTT